MTDRASNLVAEAMAAAHQYIFKMEWRDDEAHKRAIEICGALTKAIHALPDETPARRKRYFVRGRFIPISENGVMQVGLQPYPESTHEVEIVDSPEKAPAPQQHYGLGDCGCKECDWFRKHPQCRPESLGGTPKTSGDAP